MKILHVSDEHVRDRDIDEIAICLNFIVETARAEQPDLIVSAGDLFDSQDVKMGSKSAIAAVGFISALADIAPVAIIIGTPIHDGKAPEVLRFARGTFPIHVATIPEQVYLYEGAFRDGDMQDGRPQAVLTMIPQPTKQFFQTTAGVEDSDKEIGQAMTGLFAGFGASAAEHLSVPHVLVTHLNVNGCRLANGQCKTGMDIEVSVDQMNMGNFDLGCLGHIHKSQTLGEKYFYSGPIYSTKIDEVGPMGFWVHGINVTETEIGESHRFIETPCKRTVRLQCDLTTEIFSSLRIVDFLPENPDGRDVRIELTVWQDEAAEINKEEIKSLGMAAGALSVDIRINAVPREAIRAAAVLEAQTLRDEIREMSILRGESIDPEIMVMAEKLENVPGEELLKEVGA